MSQPNPEPGDETAYIVPTGYGFISYAPRPDGEWFISRWPNRAIAERWATRQPGPVVWTSEDFYGRLPGNRGEEL